MGRQVTLAPSASAFKRHNPSGSTRSVDWGSVAQQQRGAAAGEGRHAGSGIGGVGAQGQGQGQGQQSGVMGKISDMIFGW